MTTQELYKRFLLMVNKNDTNEGVNISPGHFVLLYNAEMLSWLAEELKKDADNIDVNLIELLYLGDFQVQPSGVADSVLKFIEFTLPSNFFQVYGGYTFADRGQCKDNIIYIWEKKPGDIIATRSDESSKPSFDYQETPCTIGNDKMKVYFDDFVVKSTYINYYRTPNYIDIEGYIHFDGTSSTNIDTELDDYNALQVLARVAAELDRQTVDVEGLQVSKDRLTKEF
jgi:hypothetical protein